MYTDKRYYELTTIFSQTIEKIYQILYTQIWMLAGRNTLHFCRNLQTSLVLKYFNYKKMNTFNQNQSTCEIVEVSCVDRWQVYKRLQELDIDCWCESEQPLQVYLKNTNEALSLIHI